jgi:hypothetical protein
MRESQDGLTRWGLWTSAPSAVGFLRSLRRPTPVESLAAPDVDHALPQYARPRLSTTPL